GRQWRLSVGEKSGEFDRVVSGRCDVIPGSATAVERTALGIPGVACGRLAGGSRAAGSFLGRTGVAVHIVCIPLAQPNPIEGGDFGGHKLEPAIGLVAAYG